MDDQPAALLTNTQRDVLLGETSPSRPRSMKSRLRRRVYTGLRADGVLLFEYLDKAERRAIFREWEKDWQDEQLADSPSKWLTKELAEHGSSPDLPKEMEEVERGYFREGLTDLLAFLYLGIEESGVGEFHEILESAVSRAARESGRSLKEFDLTAEMIGLASLTPETIAEKVRAGDDDVTYREIQLAKEKGALDPAEAEEIEESFEQFFDSMARAAKRMGEEAGSNEE